MKITSSNIAFQTARQYEKQIASSRTIESLEDRVSLKQSPLSIKDKQSSNEGLFVTVAEVPSTSDIEDAAIGDPKLAVMKRMIETLTGKKIQLSRVSEYDHEDATSSPPRNRYGAKASLSDGLSSVFTRFPPNTSLFRVDSPAPLFIRPNAMERQALQRVDLSEIEMPTQKVRITEVDSFYEAERTAFKSQGVVKTADGREINFALDLEMSREFYQEERTERMEERVLVDPLVVNFGGGAAELTDVRFSFDLDSDGDNEKIPWLAPGSGFLVLDRNEDGIVNDGSELFGPQSGNGFSDLAELDDDKNGWIDENDAAFEKLSVWSGETPDSGNLQSLKTAGVGAIALSNEETPFSLNDEETNETRGEIRRTGIYLSEEGRAGTIQQVDLSV